MNRRKSDFRTVPTNRAFHIVCLITVIVLAFCTSGCSSLPMSRYEQTWQTLNAIDYGQTMQTARSPSCYTEVNPVTQRLIGSHPSETEVTAVMAGYALAHYSINRFLEGKAESTGSSVWHGTLRFFQASTLLVTTRAAVRNHHFGLRPFGGAKSCALPPSAPSYDPSARPVR